MNADNKGGNAAENDDTDLPAAETDDQQPKLPAANITIPDEGEPTVEEIEEGAEPAPAADGAAAQPDRKKNRVEAKQRIKVLTREKYGYKSEAERLAAENEELRRKMAEGATKKQETDVAALAAHERSWKDRLELAKRNMIDAKGAGDAAKEADAQEQIARASAELQNIEAWRASLPKPAVPADPAPKANGHAPAPQQPQGQTVEVTPEIQAWVENNLWAVNDPRNPAFDAEMANFMANQANILEMRMRRQNRAEEIGTQTYFDEIDRLMREEFPDRFDDSEEETPVPTPQPKPQPRQQPANQRRAPAMARPNGAAVAPAAQSGSQAPRPAGRSVTLSAEERQFAHMLTDNGSLFYPQGHPQAGRRMSHADAEVAYARKKDA